MYVDSYMRIAQLCSIGLFFESPSNLFPLVFLSLFFSQKESLRDIWNLACNKLKIGPNHTWIQSLILCLFLTRMFFKLDLNVYLRRFFLTIFLPEATFSDSNLSSEFKVILILILISSEGRNYTYNFSFSVV